MNDKPFNTNDIMRMTFMGIGMALTQVALDKLAVRKLTASYTPPPAPRIVADGSAQPLLTERLGDEPLNNPSKRKIRL